MSLQPLLINGEFRAAANPTGSYQSTNPMTGEKLPVGVSLLRVG